jgi:hypothetical protein
LSEKQRFPISTSIGIAVVRAQCPCSGPELARTRIVTIRVDGFFTDGVHSMALNGIQQAGQMHTIDPLGFPLLPTVRTPNRDPRPACIVDFSSSCLICRFQRQDPSFERVLVPK